MPVTNSLRRARLDAGDLTQQQLAEKAGVTRQTIVAIERGNYNPSVELALRLAAALGTTVEALFQLDSSASEGSAR